MTAGVLSKTEWLRRTAIGVAMAWASVGCALPSADSADDVSAAAEAQQTQEEEADPNALPKAVERLQLSAEQRVEIIALRDGLRREFADVAVSGRSFLRASAPAVRRCKGDSPYIGMAASQLIRSGEAFRAPLLNAVDSLHGILTAEQRTRLVKELLGEADEEESKDEEAKDKREKRNESTVKSLGARMDLSIGQMLQLLIRLRKVQADYEDQMEPWRDKYKAALRTFAEPNFEARKQSVARGPAIKMAVKSVRKGMRVAVPLLEPPQCQELATIMLEWSEKPLRSQTKPVQQGD